MKCPLTLRETHTFRHESSTLGADCLREECAAFDKNVEECSVVGISRELGAIGNVLGRIADKLKPELFRER